MSDNGAFEVERTTAIELSRTGRARRDQMLHELQGVMTVRRRRRKVDALAATQATIRQSQLEVYLLPRPSQHIPDQTLAGGGRHPDFGDAGRGGGVSVDEWVSHH